MKCAIINLEDGKVLDLLAMEEGHSPRLSKEELATIYKRLTHGKGKKAAYNSAKRLEAEVMAVLGEQMWDLLKPEAEEPRKAEDLNIEGTFHPVATARAVFDELGAGADRQDAIAMAIAAGVNPNTARTQYYQWSKEQAL